MQVNDEAVEAATNALMLTQGDNRDVREKAVHILEAALPHLSQGAVRVDDILLKIALWSDDEGLELSMRQGDELARSIHSALSPAHVGVTGEVTYEIENEEGEFCAGADNLSDAQHYATIYEQDHPVRLVEVTRRVISSPFALSPHEAAEARIAELVKALEASRQILAKFLSAGHNFPPATPEEIDAAFWSVDSVLGGQSNE